MSGRLLALAVLAACCAYHRMVRCATHHAAMLGPLLEDTSTIWDCMALL